MEERIHFPLGNGVGKEGGREMKLKNKKIFKLNFSNSCLCDIVEKKDVYQKLRFETSSLEHTEIKYEMFYKGILVGSTKLYIEISQFCILRICCNCYLC